MNKRENLGWHFYFQRKMLTCFCMGFTSGAPLLILTSLVQAWLTDADIDIETIGRLSLVGLPYALKFLWSFWMDTCDAPLLSRLGRRRSWILNWQLCVMAGLFILSVLNQQNLTAVVATCFFITFSSASQDIVVDAYRRDDLEDEELGLGSAYYVWGYRLGMLAVSGGCLILADKYGWPAAYRVAGLLMLAGPLTFLFSPEPKVFRPVSGPLVDTVLNPLRDFFKRPAPILILLFIFFYKFGDQLAVSLTTNYYLELGYSKTNIGTVVKFFGTAAILAGISLGGWAVLRFGLRPCLWVFGFYQMITILGFAALYYLPVSKFWLAVVISQEQLSAGAGTSAFVAFMGSQTNRSFSASQYALLTALMALPRTLFSSAAGDLVAAVGWVNFYYLCTLSALPAFFVLYYLTRKGVFSYEKDKIPDALPPQG